MKTYTVEPGRAIFCNGWPCIIIGREGTLSTPHEVDKLTRHICDLLNKAQQARPVKHQQGEGTQFFVEIPKPIDFESLT